MINNMLRESETALSLVVRVVTAPGGPEAGVGRVRGGGKEVGESCSLKAKRGR